MSLARDALGGISPKISEKQANEICKSLEKNSPKLLHELTTLYEGNRARNPFDERLFSRFVVDLLYMQTRVSRSMEHSADDLKQVCDTSLKCQCCEFFKQTIQKKAYIKADEDISEMLKDDSASYKLFHTYAALAVQNERDRQAFLESHAARV